MKDRYLFKGKRLDNGQWAIGSLLSGVFFKNSGGDIPYILCPEQAEYYDCFEHLEEGNGLFAVDPATICQCTGLKDKNGTLIWENDVLREEADNLPEAIEPWYFIYKVLWSEKYTQFYCKEIYSGEELLIDDIDIEVIGSAVEHSTEDREYWNERSKQWLNIM